MLQCSGDDRSAYGDSTGGQDRTLTSNPEFDLILDEIKVQELMILAKLAELGINL
jgi:hypothetical protein